MTRILITGGAGYIGSVLTRHLRAADHDVDVSDPTVKNTRQDMSRHYQHFRGPALNGYDAIIHLAAHSSVAACEADPEGAIANNLVDLLSMARKLRGPKLIFASTGSILDPAAAQLYDTTKRAAEKALPYIYANTYSFRFGTVCGVSPVMRDDLILNGMTRDAVRTGTVRVRNPGAYRPVLFLTDLCAAMDRVIAEKMPAGVYNLASFQAKVGGWADMVAQATGAKIVDEGPTPHYDFKMMVPPTGATPPDVAIRELVEYWRARS